MAFRGTYDHSVDAKGRVSLPAKFRKALPDDLTVIPVDDENLGTALYVFSDEAFDAWVDAFFLKEDGSGYNPRSKKDIAMKHYLEASSEDVVVDAAGRIKLPAVPREQLGIGKDVQIVGCDDHIEIWDAQTHKDYMASSNPFAAFLED